MNSFTKAYWERSLTYIPENEVRLLKTKIGSNCEEYSKINVTYKSKNIYIIYSKANTILKPGKTSSVVVLHTKIYGIIKYRTFQKSYRGSYCSHREKETTVLTKIRSEFSE